MGFLKFLLKLILVVAIIAVGTAWYFYHQHQQSIPGEQPAQVVNDITGLNPIEVASIVRPINEQEVVDAILATTGPISIGGARYSMGGQIAFPDSLHLDMRDYDEVVSFDADHRLITVQSGMTWKQVQAFIDPHDLSVSIMQDFNNFTVGGSLSVNAHGRYLHAGPIINSVQSIRIALANGQIYDASREKNNALFYSAIGGYGAIGVILEATLQLQPNIALERRTQALAFPDFLPHFVDKVLTDDSIVLHHALLYPPNYESVLDVTWHKTDKPLTDTQRLTGAVEQSWWKEVLIDLISRNDLLKRMRQNLVDSYIYSKPAVVMRNRETSYDVNQFGFVSNTRSTLALREYFVPMDKFEVFVLKLRDAFIRHQVNVLNISIRHLPKDDESLLSYAPEDMFSFVVIYQEDKDEASQKKVAEWSKEMIQGAIESVGSYYMPFQIHETSEQFYRAYRDAGTFFKVKKRADPENRFNNMLWLKHYTENKHYRDAMQAESAAQVENNKPTEAVQ